MLDNMRVRLDNLETKQNGLFKQLAFCYFKLLELTLAQELKNVLIKLMRAPELKFWVFGHRIAPCLCRDFRTRPDTTRPGVQFRWPFQANWLFCGMVRLDHKQYPINVWGKCQSVLLNLFV